MSLLVETIRIDNGIPVNLEYHRNRMYRSISDLYGIRKEINLHSLIQVPGAFLSGKVKCRVEYDTEIRKTEYLRYVLREIKSLRLVEDNEIEYRYKSADRSRLDVLYGSRGDCDDILIIKNGLVTDSYYANCILRSADGSWVTPDSCLLKGTRRSSLLDKGLIREERVTVSDIKNFAEVRLINAMIDINDSESIPVENIR